MHDQISLAPYAVNWRKSKGRQIKQDSLNGERDARTHFQHDRDRIIHSGSFRRLKHKTQVFVYHEGDYFRTRLTHSLEVAQITRNIAKQLGLDDDLAEAIALAHDLGHTPFGHAGEEELDEVMARFGGFDHNEQTLRIVTELEHCYADFDGLNLTWETLEGVIKHNGPISKAKMRPAFLALDKKMKLMLDTYASMEAQVAALADDIAYLAHDCDDGIRAEFIAPKEMEGLPLVGTALRDIGKYEELKTSRLVYELKRRLIEGATQDLLTETRFRLSKVNPKNADEVRKAGRAMVAFSDGMRSDLDEVREFLRASVWKHYKVNRMVSKGRRVIRELFNLFIEQPDTLPSEWQVIDGVELPQVKEPKKARHIGDYIASMTDRYAWLEYERLFGHGAIL